MPRRDEYELRVLQKAVMAAAVTTTLAAIQ